MPWCLEVREFLGESSRPRSLLPLLIAEPCLTEQMRNPSEAQIAPQYFSRAVTNPSFQNRQGHRIDQRLRDTGSHDLDHNSQGVKVFLPAP